MEFIFEEGVKPGLLCRFSADNPCIGQTEV